jgi:hypothetical protein
MMDDELTTSTTTTRTTLSPPKVVMKMDIEMAEWLVLPDLLTSGVLCRDVDAMLAEFHTGGRPEKEYPIHFAAPPPHHHHRTHHHNNNNLEVVTTLQPIPSLGRWNPTWMPNN